MQIKRWEKSPGYTLHTTHSTVERKLLIIVRRGTRCHLKITLSISSVPLKATGLMCWIRFDFMSFSRYVQFSMATVLLWNKSDLLIWGFYISKYKSLFSCFNIPDMISEQWGGSYWENILLLHLSIRRLRHLGQPGSQWEASVRSCDSSASNHSQSFSWKEDFCSRTGAKLSLRNLD